jgi:starch-binding outer membrane protein, SusD/RagB family
MKKQPLLLIVTVLILFVSACDKKFLTRDNPTSTTDDLWWTTEAQLTAALTVIYNQLPTGAFQYRDETRISFSTITDDAVWTANYHADLNAIALGNASSNMPAETYRSIEPMWTSFFKNIRNANRFLKNAGKAFMLDENLKHRYMYEARAARAFYHLHLFLYYGVPPIVDKDVSPEESDLKRSELPQFIDWLTKELDTCANELPVQYLTDEPYRFTRGACLTLKTVAYLNAKMYTEAAAAAKAVIDMNFYELYHYQQDSSLSYRNLFFYVGEFNKERILSCQASGFTNNGRLSPPPYGSSNVNPTATIVNDYETRQGKTIWELGTDSVAIYKKNPNYNNNRDPRFDVSVVYPGQNFLGILINPFNTAASNTHALNVVNSSRTGYWVAKYADPIDKGKTSSLDFMIYRYADVLLMYVEALVESGQWNHPDVVKYLNMIRKRARMPEVNTTVYNSETKMRELYRRERHIELAFEGHRLFDIRRWKIAEQVMNVTVEGATNPANGQTVIVETRHFDAARDYLWPIPLREIQGNPNMKQNPNY